MDNAIHRINHYPLDSAISFATTYPLGSDLSVGLRNPTFEQPGPDWLKAKKKNATGNYDKRIAYFN